MRVCITDGGVGFEPHKAISFNSREGGFGLFSIRERLEQLDGKLEIKSAPGCGCEVAVIVPLKT